MFLSLIAFLSLAITGCDVVIAAVVERAGNITLQAPIVAAPSEHWSVYEMPNSDIRPTNNSICIGKATMAHGQHSRSEWEHQLKYPESCQQLRGKRPG
jgi:hypothetical protein